MTTIRVVLASLVLLLFFSSLAEAQQPGDSAAANPPVPRVVKFSGAITDAESKTISGIAGITFSIYKEQQGGAALWMETQNVTLDTTGHYHALLGEATPGGLPVELFASGDARWIGVQVEGQPEHSRVLLLSVPYALKAADAETIGGLPPSAFVRANAVQGAETTTKTPTPTRSSAKSAAPPANPAVTGVGTLNSIPVWDSASDIVSSMISQKSSAIGIGTTAPAATLDVNGKGDVRDTLTLFPRGTDSTLAVNGTTFKVDQTGKVTFVSGQTFPGVGTVTSVGLSAPATDFTVSGSPVTSTGTLNFAWKVPPTNANTPNAIVKRDASGNFSAGAISAGTLSGSGAGVTNVNAALLGGVAPGGYANLATVNMFTQPLTIKAAASSTPLLTVEGTGTGAGAFTVDGFGNVIVAAGSGAAAQNLLIGVGPVTSVGTWGGYSALNLISGTSLYPITSAHTVFYIGFTGGTVADINNMVLYETAQRGSNKISAVTPVKLHGVSNPSIALTQTSICPVQPISPANPCIVRLDPIAVSLSALANYYFVVFFTNDANNNAISSATPTSQLTSLAGFYIFADESRLSVGQSVPSGSGPSNFLMAVMTN
jgi:hypothetical protein